MPGEVGAAAHAAWPTVVLGVGRHRAEAHRLAFRLIHIAVRSEYPKMRLLVGLRPEVRSRDPGGAPGAVVADDFHRIRIAHHLDFRIEE